SVSFALTGRVLPKTRLARRASPGGRTFFSQGKSLGRGSSASSQSDEELDSPPRSTLRSSERPSRPNTDRIPIDASSIQAPARFRIVSSTPTEEAPKSPSTGQYRVSPSATFEAPRNRASIDPVRPSRPETP